MAIVQISRITNRKGLQENLPQLAGAELGWSIDERRLFIGNGTLQEGAPVIGNTEILTEFSDIFDLQGAYTYQGESAGYIVQTGPTPGEPVVQTLQTWMDQFATVKDFGATGDGLTDDTNAINRALYQLYCIDNNTQTRRSLFFPAGTYRITDTIYIPAYATLYGEGADGSIIQLDNLDDSANKPVAQTVASLIIGMDGVSYDPVAGATQNITVSNLGFSNLNQEQNVFVFQNASVCSFKNIGFYGPLTTASLTDPNPNSAGVAFINTSGQTCKNITIDTAEYSGTVWGVASNDDINGITISNSNFYNLYQGVVLGIGAIVGNGPTGVRIVSNTFDSVYAEGIVFDNTTLNASAQNIFYNVGDYFVAGTPQTAIINIQNNNNVSIGDLFQRNDVDAASVARINLNNTVSIATTNGSQLQLGNYTRQSGQTQTLVNNTSSATAIFSSTALALSVNYTITRGTSYRTGTLVIANSATPVVTDDYNQTATTGIILSVTESAGTISLNYTSTSTGTNGTIYYSVTVLA